MKHQNKIKTNLFVDLRSRWLKEPDADSTELFRMVAEIFILWCKSNVSPTAGSVAVFLLITDQHFSFCVLVQNFKREEQNFVIQNEINNLGFLTGEGKTKMSKVKM